MSQENVEIVRTMWEQFARGDYSAWADLPDDFEFVTSPDVPDGRTYRGEAAIRWMTAWVESFEGHTIEASEIVDAGDKVFVAILPRRRPHGSQTVMEGRWWVGTTLRGGEIVRTEVFSERAPALEAAGLVGGQEVVGGHAAALASVTRPGFDGRAVAVSERRLPGVPVSGGGTSAAAGDAQVVRDENERVVVRAHAARNGVLVLTDTYFPGWRAKVDERDVSIAQVDYLLRWVPITPGTHRIEFRYDPLSWMVGWITSVRALLDFRERSRSGCGGVAALHHLPPGRAGEAQPGTVREPW